MRIGRSRSITGCSTSTARSASPRELAVHVGGYRLPPNDPFQCGRLTALEMRIDLPAVLAWITAHD
jgi:hypothetical protein